MLDVVLAARLVAAALGDAFGAAPYIAVLTFLVRLLQSTSIPWWRGWSTFAVVCSAEGLLNVGVLSLTCAV